jgi:hypothetical protein
MAQATLLSPAPNLSAGVYIHIGNGGRFHIAASEKAPSTACGLSLGPAVYRTTEVPRLSPTGYPLMCLGDICRRCAQRRVELAGLLRETDELEA